MKRLLIILFLLCSIAAFSQSPPFGQTIGAPNINVKVKGGLFIDSVFWPTLRDTFWTPSAEGAITYWQTNRHFYGFQNGHWQLLGGSVWGQISGTLSNQTDLIDSLNARQRVLLAGYGISILGTTILIDTAVFRKVDTVYRVNDSTVGFKVNTIPYSFLIRGNATGGTGVTIVNNLSPLFTASISVHTLSFALINQNANLVYAGPAIGSAAAPTFRGLAIADLPFGIPNANLANANLNFSIGSSGSSPNWQTSSVNLGSTAVLNLPTASGTNSGILSNTDWTIFNNKVTSVNGLTGVVVTKSADSIKKLPVDTTTNRNGYVLTFDSTNHKWYLSPGGGGGGGSITVGALDGNGASANGLSISGSTIYAQSASVSAPGLVSTGTQTFTGNKTFSAQFLLTGLTNKSFVSTDSVVVRDNTGKLWTEVFPVRSVSGNAPISVATGLTTPVISVDTAQGTNSVATYYQLTHLGVDTIFFAYQGASGDSLMHASGDTIYSPRIIDSAGFHHYFKIDGTLVMYTQGGGGSGSTSATITCTACGFTVGKVVSKNLTTWVLADTISNYPDGVISQIIDANTFVVTFAGPMTWTSGLTVGTNYFQSTVSGGLTATSPVISIPIGKPISSSIFNVAIKRGFNFTSSAGTGNTNTNVGSAFRWAIPGTNQIKTFACVGCTIDSATSNTLTLTVTASGTGATTKTILCTACGFAVGDVVSKNSSTWVKADTISNYPNGVISLVVDANHFVVTTSGPMLWTAHGKTIGADYFLSTTAGATTSTSPIVSIPILKPIATDTVLVAIQRGFNFSATNVALTTSHLLIGNGSNIAVDAPSTGDVGYAFSAGNAVATIANNAVSNAKLAQMAANSIKINNTGSPANAIDGTATQVTAMLNQFTISLQGLVPPPGAATGKILSDNGTWVVNAAAVSSVSAANTTLTISPTTGAVIAGLNLANANTWTGQQTFNTSAPIFGTTTIGSVHFSGASGILATDLANFFWDNTNKQLQIQKTAIGTTFSDANGLLIQNTQASTVSQNQWSPPLVLSATGWKTAATAGSQVAKAGIYLATANSTNSPTAQIIFQQNVNGGAYQKNMVIGSNSVIMANNNAPNTGFYVGNNVDPVNPFGTSYIGIALINGATGETRLWVGTSDFLTIYSNGSEALRIPTSGNLLVGTTVDNAAYIQASASTAAKASMFLNGAAVDVTTPTNGMLWYNSTTHALNFRDNGTTFNILSAAATPTFQQTLTAGSIMTGANTVNTAGNLFTFATGTVDYSGMPTAKNVSSFLSSAFASGITLANTIRLNQTVATSGSAQGEEIYVKTSNATGNIGAAWGSISIVEHAGAGSVAIGRAYQAEVLMTGGGTMTEATGIQTSGVHIGGGGTVTNSYGIYVAADDAGSGAITNSYPIWQDQTNGINVFKSIMRLDNLPAASGTVTMVTQQTDNTLSEMAVASSGFTPTLSNTSNITTSGNTQATYVRVGNIVTVTISGALTPTATNTLSAITATLPITTSISSQVGAGTATFAVNSGTLGWIAGECDVISTTQVQMKFFSGSVATSGQFMMTFQYKL